ncbi:MAG: N-acetylmuramoyl-L-alanine amidase [Candidatus Margulisiibacteriota bacterium]
MKKLYILVFTIIMAACSFGQELLSVSVEARASGEQVVMDFSSQPKVRQFFLKEPDRLVLDFEGSVWNGGKKEIVSAGKNFSKVRWAQNSYSPDVARVVVDLGATAVPELVSENDGKRLALKFPGAEEVAAAEVKQPSAEELQPAEKENTLPQVVIAPPKKITLPDLSKSPKFSIYAEGTRLDTGAFQVFDKRVLMVPVKTLFESLGYKVSSGRGGLSIKASFSGASDVNFYLNSNKMAIGEVERVMARPAKKIKGRIYVPLVSTVKWLGYSVLWDKTSKALSVLPLINGISYPEHEGKKYVFISSNSQVVTWESKTREEPLLLAVSIPGFILDLDQDRLSINQDGIKGVKALQKRDGSVSIGIYLLEPQSYDIKAVENGLLVSFPPAVSSIRATEEAEAVKIDISMTKRAEPQVKRLANPDRLIVDIPGSAFEAQKYLEIGKGGVLRVRASQFMIEPLVSRVVIDLQKELNYDLKVSEDKKTISIYVEKAEVAARKTKIVKALKGKVIVLDPGHGGSDPGAFGYSGESVKEKDLNLAIAQLLAKMLSDAGAAVLLTREDDMDMSLQNRVDFANRNKADILLCMHYNSFYKTTTAGTETYYYNPNSKLLASVIHRRLLEDLRRENRAFSKVKFFVIANVEMPAALLEPVYISNPEEERLALDSGFQEKAAKSVFDGVKEYFEIIARVR